MSIGHDWFAALGKPVSREGHEAALRLLSEEGLDAGEGVLVLAVVAREIEHDQPDRAQRYLRHWLPAHGSEVLLIRTLAYLCCPSLTHDQMHRILLEMTEGKGHT